MSNEENKDPGGDTPQKAEDQATPEAQTNQPESQPQQEQPQNQTENPNQSVTHTNKGIS